MASAPSPSSSLLGPTWSSAKWESCATSGDRVWGSGKAPGGVKCPPRRAGRAGPGACGELHLPSPGGPQVVSPPSPTRSSRDTGPPGWVLSAPSSAGEAAGVRSGEPPEGQALAFHRAWEQRCAGTALSLPSLQDSRLGCQSVEAGGRRETPGSETEDGQGGSILCWSRAPCPQGHSCTRRAAPQARSLSSGTPDLPNELSVPCS